MLLLFNPKVQSRGFLLFNKGTTNVINAGVAPVYVTFAATETGDVVSITGTVTNTSVTVAVNVLEQHDVVAVTALSKVTASVAVTDRHDTAAISLAAKVAAAIAVTEHHDTASINGNIKVTTRVAVVDRHDTANVVGNIKVVANVAIVERHDGVAISVHVGSGSSKANIIKQGLFNTGNNVMGGLWN